MWLRINILLNILYFSLAEIVVFPSGEHLETIPSHPEYNDVKATGSYLFDSTDKMETRLTLYIMVEDFKSTHSQYFRAHPLFMSCLQKIKRVFDDDDKEIIISGFKTRQDPRTGNQVVDDYSHSGAGAELSLADGSEAVDIAKTAVQQCWTIFQEHQRDMGIVLFQNKVHIHLRGLSSPEESKPYFDIVSGASIRNVQEFKRKVQEWLNEGLELKVDPPCDSDEVELQRGQNYPEYNTPEEVVGDVDQPITAASPEDLKTLWQLSGTDITFNGCPDGMNSNHLDKRCVNRLMSPRLYNVIRVLHKLVKNNGLGSLNVISAYKECRPGDSDLHCEGRAANLRVNGDLSTFSRMAICAGADYVSNKGNNILIAVRKQKGSSEHWVTFPQTALLDVSPPQSQKDKYNLPEDPPEYIPLFDSNHQEADTLSEFATIADFKEKNSRYFRVDPHLVHCHAEIILKVQQRKQNIKNIYIITAYKSSNMPKDHAATNEKHLLQQNGHGMVINYYNDNRQMSGEEYISLANAIIDRCAPIFTRNGRELHMIVGPKGVFVGMSLEVVIEIKEPIRLPEHETVDHMKTKLRERYDMASDGHIIDPDDYENSCLFSDAPKMRSISFIHKHSEAIRVRREAPSPDDCIPESDTDFCRTSTAAREKAVSRLKKEIFRKWIYVDKVDFTKALDGCLSICGTCFTGDIWHDKTENCNNFIHWIPFELYNEEDEERDKSNFYSRENLELQHHACSEHCIDKTPLFAIVGPTIEGIFRPNPEQSVEERLYPTSGNPSPLFDLLLKMYAMHAHGHATFWVQDEFELAAQRESMKTIMVYNKKITGVSIYVNDPEALDAVSLAIANLVLEWTKSSCPEESRDFIPRYSVEEMPPHRNKRSESDEFASNLLYKQFHYDEEWLNKINYL